MAKTTIPSELIADNAVGITQLNVSDGSNGQFLKTDGSGTLSFGTVSTTTALDDIATGDAASTLATSSGDITIDSPVDIILDADSGVWRFKDDGTTLLQFAKDGATMKIYSAVSDADIMFQGNDGGSTVNALTFDMSEAGRATFNEDVIAPGIYVGSRNASFDFYNNGTSYFNGAVTIDDNLGIGTTSPSSKLSVKADQENLIDLQRTTTTTGAAYTKFINDGGNYYIGVDSSAGNRLFASGGAAYALSLTTESARDICLGTNNTERMRISSAGIVTKPYQPAFHAYGPSSATSGANVIYQNTYVNTGSHYSTTNGRFTAPVAGVYLFFWSAIGNSTNDVYRFFLYKNGSVNAGGGNDIHLRQDTLATGSEYATNGSRVQMLSLAANDYVNIYFEADSNNGHYVQSDYSNFGGYLIG